MQCGWGPRRRSSRLSRHLPQRLKEQASRIHAPSHLILERDSTAACQQRATAKIEEVVSCIDLADPQGLAPDVGEKLLRPGRWRLAESHIVANRPEYVGQCAAIELAVCRQRERLQRQDKGWNHVFRQAGPQIAADLADRQILSAVDDDVSDDTYVSRTGLARDDSGLTDHRVGIEGRLDLAELDAKAANLYLAVNPPEMLQPPIGQPTTEIAGAIQPAAGAIAEAVVHKAFGRKLGLAMISKCHAIAADPDFACHSDGNRLACLVHDGQLGIGNRAADQHHANCGLDLLYARP